MTEVGRHLWESNLPCSTQNHPQPPAQDPISFWIYPMMVTYQPLWAIPASAQSPWQQERISSIQRESPVFPVRPLPQRCHWALLTGAWLPHLCAIPPVFIHIDGIRASLLFSRMKSPSSLSLSWWSSPSSSCHFAGFSLLAPFPSCATEPRTGHRTTGVMKITK